MKSEIELSYQQRNAIDKFNASPSYIVSRASFDVDLKGLDKRQLENLLDEELSVLSIIKDEGLEKRNPSLELLSGEKTILIEVLLEGSSIGLTSDLEEVDKCISMLSGSVPGTNGLARVAPSIQGKTVLTFVFKPFVIDPAGLDILVSRIIKRICSAPDLNIDKQPKDRMTYQEYSNWQNQINETEESVLGRQYWNMQEKKGGCSIDLPWHNNSISGDFRHSHTVVNLMLSNELVSKITSLRSRFGISRRALYLYGWILLQERISGKSNFITNIRTSIRDEDELAELIGPCDRIIPIVFNSLSHVPVIQNIESLEEELEEAVEWQECFTSSESNKNHSIFSMTDCSRSATHDGITFDVEPSESYGAADLIVNILNEETVRIIGSAFYLDDTAINLVAEYYIQCLEHVVSGPLSVGRRIDLVSPHRNCELTTSGIATDDVERGPLKSFTLNQNFFSNVAIRCSGLDITYRELNSKVEDYCKKLTKRGVSNTSTVAINLDHSIDLIVTILAVVSVGANFIGVPTYTPKNRVKKILEESSVNFVIFRGENKLVIESLAHSETNDLAPNLKLIPLVYKIFTSGTTGQPKAIEIESDALDLQLSSLQEVLELTDNDRVLLRTSIGFDAFIWELFLPLRVGASIVVPNKSLDHDVQRMSQTILSNGVTVLQMTPSLLKAFTDETGVESLNGLSKLVIGGEQLMSAHISSSIIGPDLFNVYGPSEACIQATVYNISRPLTAKAIPIGRSLNGYCCQIFDEMNNELAIGLVGELCISGRALFRGYCNSVKETQDVLFETFDGDSKTIWYRTGDRARQLPDGNFEFLGRTKAFNKIQGYRVDPLEIELAIQRFSGVSQVTVVEITQSDKALLFAVYTKEDDQVEVREEALKEFLLRDLPYYMVPSRFIELASLPLTKNGKVDLEKISGYITAACDEKFLSPRTHTEKLIHGFWEQLVGVKAISIRDNFYMLGGHSLLFAKLINQINRKWNLELSMVQILKYTTIAELAAFVDEQQARALRPES